MTLRLTLMMLLGPTIGAFCFCDLAQAQRFRFRLSAAQGSSRSITSTSAHASLPNGGAGSVSSGMLTPFVTGFVPIVGYRPVWHHQALPASRGSLPKIELTERQQRRVEANDALRKRTLDRYLRKAEHELRSGRAGTARVYYRMALKRAQGDSRDEIESKILQLEDLALWKKP
ncbi:MAG: hypothetical protein GY768_31975 [Planctomycetaceae bacterium]|nr:hypothetical protein [Planctomycetaceae bacterium]